MKKKPLSFSCGRTRKACLRLCLAFSMLLLSGTPASPVQARCPDGLYTVLKVLDGRSFEVAGGLSIRLIGVGLPEGEKAGTEARDALCRLLKDGVVTLEGDLRDQDDEGFYLRYVHGEGLFVNREMIRLGVAFFRSVEPNVKHDRELAAAAAAEPEKGRSNQWGSDCPSGCYVYVGSEGMTFHVFGCPFLEGSASRVCRDEAIQRGYTACGHCGGGCDDHGGDWYVHGSCFVDTLSGDSKRRVLERAGP